VSRDRLTAALAVAGYGDADAASRAALVQQAEGAFQHHAGHRPRWRWFVPGRIEVFGKHTDYAGGRSLMTAVPRGFAVVAAPRDDNRVTVCDASDGSVTIDRRNSTPAQGWTVYPTTVARRLAANFPDAPLGIDIVFLSDLPRAAGLSSSSALVVGVASALIRRGDLDQTPHWASAIASPHDLAWYLGCVENGLDFPGLPGSDGVGTLGGSEDHTAILTCRAGHLSQNRYAPVAHLGDVGMPPGWTFVVATSGVPADKTGSALERYNRLSRATAVLTSLWNQSATRASTPAPTLAAVLASAPDAGERLRILIKASRNAAFDPDTLSRRLTQFISEDARVPQAAAAFAAADVAQLSTLTAASQRDADLLLGNQIDETRALVGAALDAGAAAASSFGAGFGGSVWALAPTDEAPRVGAAWVDAYRARCPHAGPVEWFVAAPGPSRLAFESA
jgi:galactokinase